MSGQSNSNVAKARIPPAFDPKAPALVQPYRRLVEEGFIVKLTVEFTPMGVNISGVPDARVASVTDSGLTAGAPAALGLILAAADKGNLVPKAGKKSTGPKAQPLPEKSLDKKDFEGSQAELLARARRVAQACGDKTLVGRVRTANAFDGKVTTSFADWWASADAKKRSAALMVPSKAKDLTEADLAKLTNLECPFRGSAEFVVAESEQTQPSKKVGSAPQKK